MTEEDLVERLFQSLTSAAWVMTPVELVSLILHANAGWEAMADEITLAVTSSQAGSLTWEPTLADGLGSFTADRLARLQEIVGVQLVEPDMITMVDGSIIRRI